MRPQDQPLCDVVPETGGFRLWVETSAGGRRLIVVWEGNVGWRWHVKAANGRIIAASEELFRKRAYCISKAFTAAGIFGAIPRAETNR